MKLFLFKKSKYKVFRKFPVTGKPYIGRDTQGHYIVVGKTEVMASYSPEFLKRAELHLKRLK